MHLTATIPSLLRRDRGDTHGTRSRHAVLLETPPVAGGTAALRVARDGAEARVEFDTGTGTKEITVITEGGNRILVEVPGVEDPEALKRLIGQTAKLGCSEGKFLSGVLEPAEVKKHASSKVSNHPSGCDVVRSFRSQKSHRFVRMRKSTVRVTEHFGSDDAVECADLFDDICRERLSRAIVLQRFCIIQPPLGYPGKIDKCQKTIIFQTWIGRVDRGQARLQSSLCVIIAVQMDQSFTLPDAHDAEDGSVFRAAQVRLQSFIDVDGFLPFSDTDELRRILELLLQ